MIFESLKIQKYFLSGKYAGEIKRYLLLLLLPLILGIALFFCIHAITSNQIEQRGTATAKHLSGNASGILHEMQLVSDSLLNDSYFLHEITSDSISNPSQLCSTIRKHLHESSYVNNAFVVSKKHNHIYGADSYFLYDGLQTVLRDVVIQEQDENENTLPLSLNYDPGWHILNANFAPPYYVASIPGLKSEDTFLLVTLNVREFLRSFYATDADMCCIFNDHFSFSTLLKNYPNLDWRSPDEVNRIMGEKVCCFYVESGDFTFLTAISVRDYRAPLRTVLYVFGIYFILVFAVGLIYLFQISKRRYRAVAEMVDGLPHGLGADPTYEDVLSAVRKSLNAYRDKYNEDRERSISVQLQHILTGSYLKHLTAQQLSAAGILPECLGYYVCLLHIRDQNVLVNSGPLPLNIDATCMIFKSAFARFSNGKLDATAAFIENKYYAVFSVKEEVDREYVRLVVHSTTSLIEGEYGLKINSAVSEFISDPEQLKSAFIETNSLYRFSTSIGSFAHVVLQDDMESKMSAILNGSYLKQVEMLSRALIMEKYDVVPSMVEVILDEHVSGLGKHYALANDRLTSVATLLAETIMASGIPNDEAKVLARALRESDSIATLNERTKDTFNILLKHPRHLENDSIISKACLYISQNLSNSNLSVPEISQAVSVSVQHLSRLFRQKLNTTILEYINACRIELAKKTLVETNLTVSQVAEISGYNNTVTLSRNFKRYVGIPPSEYREMNK